MVDGESKNGGDPSIGDALWRLRIACVMAGVVGIPTDGRPAEQVLAESRQTIEEIKRAAGAIDGQG